VESRDQYKYFRVEARELLDGLGQGALELEKGTSGSELVIHMLRLAHTLKGAARVVRQPPIAERAHAVEDLLAPHREKGAGPVARAGVDRLLALLDEMTALVAKLDAPPSVPQAAASGAAAQEAPKPARADEPLKNVRVEIAEMDALLAGVFESHVHLAAIRRDMEDLSRSRALARSLVELAPRGSRAKAVAEELAGGLARTERNLASSLERAQRETTEVGDRASQLRLLAASTIFPTLERAVRDAAQSLRKTVRFETSGGDHRLEAHVLLALRDGLLHVVRNAVAHGIEPEAARAAAGKPAAGHVRVDVQRRGNRVAFVCSDDGPGIDVEAVRRSAIARGLAAADLAPKEVFRLILESGVTTTDRVTEVSGRGIGLDVLRNTVAQLKGDVVLSSQPGQGATIDICVPLSVSSIAAILVEAGGLTVSIPLDAVRCTLALAPGDVVRSGDGDSIVVDESLVPFAPLANALKRTSSDGAGTRRWTAVVVQAGSRAAAVGVDRLIGRTSIVLRPLPALAGPIPIAAGASLDADGNPQLVVDPRTLVDSAHAKDRVSAPAEATAKATPTILVIDDSLTTRMLEQSILESAGYRVELATSAEEGIAKARARNGEGAYGLFLVDVEMPGIDGFEFVARTRADPLLRGTPAILVTSRDAPQDRRRGEDVGARAYIVKGEFDQGHLLKVIRQLIG
jgi:two-component system chemotaxis sensor kinase CheA